MKKIFKVSLALLATLSLSVSCNKEINGIEDDNTITEQQGIPVTITASLSGELTKVALTQDPDNADGAVKLTWAAGDKIRVASHADPTKFSELTLSSGAGYKTAEFSGELAPGVVAPYDISYNSAGSSYNYAEQTQSADANTAHLKYIATLSSVSTYENVDFTEEWATANGGTFVRSSVLRLRANLPAGVAATVKSVIIRASKNWVDGGNQIKVNITTPGDAGSDGIINVYATLPASASTLSADATMEFIFETPEHDYLRQLTKEDIGGKTFEMGKVNAIKLNCNTVGSNVVYDDFAGGTGVDDDPWLISNPRQMVKIKDKLKAGETKYFKLIDDIDLQGVSWTPVVTGKPYNRCINFDGNNKVISNLNTKNDVGYPSLFGIFNGIAKDLTIKDATINHTTSGTDIAGVFASYIGAGTIDFSPDVRGIVIQNCTVGAESSRITSYVGGLAGQVENSDVTIKDVQVIDTDIFGPSSSGAAGGVIGHVNSSVNIEKVSFRGSVKGYWYVGGLIGVIEKIPTGKTANLTKSYSTGSVEGLYRYVGGLVGANKTGNTSAPFNIKNCYSTGSVTAGGYAAGILGSHQSSSATNLENCYSTSPVTASWSCGGIVAQATTSGLSVIRCMPFNTSITATCLDADQHYTCGAVIAYAKSVNVVVNYCYRIKNLASNFQDCPGNSANVIEQHSFITTAGAIPQRKSLTYGYYHHGRNTNYSLCELIHSGAIGENWSSEIWDWSGSIPTLK